MVSFTETQPPNSALTSLGLNPAGDSPEDALRVTPPGPASPQPAAGGKALAPRSVAQWELALRQSDSDREEEELAVAREPESAEELAATAARAAAGEHQERGNAAFARCGVSWCARCPC